MGIIYVNETKHWCGYIAYEDYILIEEKVEQHETIDWSEYIKMFERYNSNHGNNIFTINVLKKSDYQIKKIDCIEEANIFIEKQKALYNDIKNWIEE